MAALRDIKKRIRSVTGSQKITRAMKLVAASKLRRAQETASQTRPYADEVKAMVARVAAAPGQGDDGETIHPLCEVRPSKTTLLVVITSDRGSCGAFNSNIVRRVDRFMREQAAPGRTFVLMTLGRKGNDAFAKRPGLKLTYAPDLLGAPRFARIEQLAKTITAQFARGDIDDAIVISNEAQSALVQHVRLAALLPVSPGRPPPEEDGVSYGDYQFAPSRQALLAALVPRLIAVTLQRAIYESIAAEHGARMSAMDAATKNAGQMVERLTLQYNRARQAAITLELMDIVGGAEALSG